MLHHAEFYYYILIIEITNIYKQN